MTITSFFTPKNINNAKEQYLSEISQTHKNKKSNSFTEYIRKIFFHIITLRLKSLEKRDINFQQIKSVLIIRNDGIGDWILSTPLVEYLKQINPLITIDVIASHRNRDLVKANPHITNIFTLNHKPSLLELIKIGLLIRKTNQYDLIICLKNTEFTKQMLLLKIATRKIIPTITFSHSNPIRQQAYKLAFTNTTNVFDLSHFSETLLELIKFNSKNSISFQIEPTLYISNSNIENIRSIINTYNLNYRYNSNTNLFNNGISSDHKKKDFIVLNVSGFEDDRKLCESKIIELVHSILKNSENSIVFLSGANNDKNKIIEYEKKINSNFCKSLDLKIMDFAEFLAGAKCLISPDSGPIHIASALNTPVIGFYNSYDKLIKWHPLSTKYVAILKKNISEINQKDILQAIDLLNLQ